MISSVIADIDTKLIITVADEQLAKCPRLRDEQTIAAEIIDEIDSTRDDVAERLEPVLLVSGTFRITIGEREYSNTKAEAIEPTAKNIDEIAVLDTVTIAWDNVSTSESNSKIDKKVDKLTTKLDGQTVTKMSEKVDRAEHCKVDADENGRVEAIAKTKKFEESSTMGKFNSFQKF